MLTLLAALGAPMPAYADVAAANSVSLQAAAPAPQLNVDVAWQLSEEEHRALLDSCSNAYAHGTCQEGVSGASPGALWGRIESQSTDRVLIELHVTDRAAERIVSRDLTFQAEDGPVERAKAVGLTLGVLAAAMSDSLAAPAPPEPTQSAPEVEEVPSDTGKRIYVSALVGLARDPSLTDFEGTAGLRGQLRLFSNGFLLRGGFDGSLTRLHDDQLAVSRLDPTLGIGWLFGGEPLAWIVGLDGGPEWIRATARGPGRQEAASRWSPLMRVSATGLIELTPSFGLSLSAQLNLSSSPTTFYLRGEEVERTSFAQLGLLFGIYGAFGGQP